MPSHPRCMALPAAIVLHWMSYALATAINTTAMSAQPQQNAVPTPAPEYSLIQDIVPKSIITFFGLVLFALIGLGIAKLVDRFHDSVELRDDTSDISEHTRDLLKARLAVFAFTPARLRSEADAKIRDMERARTYGRIWMAKVAQSRQKKRNESQKAILNGVKETFAAKTNSVSAVEPMAHTVVTPIVASLDSNGGVTDNLDSTATITSDSNSMPERPKLTIASHKQTEDIAINNNNTAVGERNVEATTKSDVNNVGVISVGDNMTATNKMKTRIKTSTYKPSLANKRNNDFIAIDIQNLEESRQKCKVKTIPVTSHNMHIDFWEVSENVTMPARVSTDDAPFPQRTLRVDTTPAPRPAYEESEFGSDDSLRQVDTPPVAGKSDAGRPGTSDGFNIMRLSFEASSDSLRNFVTPTRYNGAATAPRPITATTTATAASRPATSNTTSAVNSCSRTPFPPATRDSRPMTSQSIATRVKFLRPLTAGRAHLITQGGRGDRVNVAPKSASRRGQ